MLDKLRNIKEWVVYAIVVAILSCIPLVPEGENGYGRLAVFGAAVAVGVGLYLVSHDKNDNTPTPTLSH